MRQLTEAAYVRREHVRFGSVMAAYLNWAMTVVRLFTKLACHSSSSYNRACESRASNRDRAATCSEIEKARDLLYKRPLSRSGSAAGQLIMLIKKFEKDCLERTDGHNAVRVQKTKAGSPTANERKVSQHLTAPRRCFNSF